VELRFARLTPGPQGDVGLGQDKQDGQEKEAWVGARTAGRAGRATDVGQAHPRRCAMRCSSDQVRIICALYDTCAAAAVDRGQWYGSCWFLKIQRHGSGCPVPRLVA
jgi:hypothetical protein